MYNWIYFFLFLFPLFSPPSYSCDKESSECSQETGAISSGTPGGGVKPSSYFSITGGLLTYADIDSCHHKHMLILTHVITNIC